MRSWALGTVLRYQVDCRLLLIAEHGQLLPMLGLQRTAQFCLLGHAERCTTS